MTQDDIGQIVSTVWDTLFQSAIEPARDDSAGGDRIDLMAALVTIGGAWDGMVMVQCGAGLARQAASVLFSRASADCEAADLEDALCELGNIVAGNLKTLLPFPSFLGIPAMVRQIGWKNLAHGKVVTARAGFDWQGEPLIVTVLENVAVDAVSTGRTV